MGRSTSSKRSANSNDGLDAKKQKRSMPEGFKEKTINGVTRTVWGGWLNAKIAEATIDKIFFQHRDDDEKEEKITMKVSSDDLPSELVEQIQEVDAAIAEYVKDNPDKKQSPMLKDGEMKIIHYAQLNAKKKKQMLSVPHRLSMSSAVLTYYFDFAPEGGDGKSWVGVNLKSANGSTTKINQIKTKSNAKAGEAKAKAKDTAEEEGAAAE